ncbi:MAG: hypothetical protein WBA68_05475 [Alteraurantiacibacter sp.]
MSGNDVADGNLPRWSLRGWPGKVRKSRVVRLFIFEFTVILFGVLAAQGLQAMFSARAEKQRAVEIRAALDQQVENVLFSVEVRLRRQQCDSYRLREAFAAYRDRRAATVSLAPPSYTYMPRIDWSGDTPALILKHYGRKTAMAYGQISEASMFVQDTFDEEDRAWARVGRIAAEPVSEADAEAAVVGIIDAGRLLTRNAAYAQGLLARVKFLEVDKDLSSFETYRGSPDICSQAIGYTLDEHRAALEEGKLVTGQDIALD